MTTESDNPPGYELPRRIGLGGSSVVWEATPAVHRAAGRPQDARGRRHRPGGAAPVRARAQGDELARHPPRDRHDLRRGRHRHKPWLAMSTAAAAHSRSTSSSTARSTRWSAAGRGGLPGKEREPAAMSSHSFPAPFPRSPSAAATAVGRVAPAWADPGRGRHGVRRRRRRRRRRALQITETIGSGSRAPRTRPANARCTRPPVTAVRTESPSGALPQASGDRRAADRHDPGRRPRADRHRYQTLRRCATPSAACPTATPCVGLPRRRVGRPGPARVVRDTGRGPRHAAPAALGCVDTSDGSTAVFSAGPWPPGGGLPVTLGYPTGPATEPRGPGRRAGRRLAPARRGASACSVSRLA